MRRVRLTLLRAGHCTHPEWVVLRGGRRRSVAFPATCALIEHPELGPLLFDTGYAPRFFAAAHPWPYCLYARITPVFVRPDQTAAAQLAARGFDPDAVQTVVLSHLHADHLAGLKDFPKARILCPRPAYEAVGSLRGWRALRAGFLPDLMPTDFESRAELIDLDACTVPAPEPFGYGLDLLGDGSLVGVPLPGHARGQLGVFLETETGRRVLLAADAAWLLRAVREDRPPHPLAHLALDDARAARRTLHRLHRLHAAHPEIAIVPSHCAEACAPWCDREAPA